MSSNINRISTKEIWQLEPEQLVDLLNILISCELKNNFTTEEIIRAEVPKPITIKDGGGDAIVELNINNSRQINTEWIKFHLTIIQSKAQKMSAPACKNEILQNPSSRVNVTLKSEVERCLSNEGEYILFTKDAFSTASKLARVNAIREGLSRANFPNPSAAKIRILDANQITKWANQNISAIIFIFKCLNIHRPECFMTWSEWKSQFEIEANYKYQETDFLQDLSNKLISNLTINKVARVIGHKGIGKSRFVFETFNFKNNPPIKVLTDAIVYVDLALIQPETISAFIISNIEINGILIIDNCGEEWHTAYKTHILSRGNFKIITINDNIGNANNEYIIIDRINQRIAVRRMIADSFSGLQDHEIDRILDITDGFPEMVNFISMVMADSKSMSFLKNIDYEFVKDFIFGKMERDNYEYELLKACSIFSDFMFIDDRIEDFISSDIKESCSKQNEIIYNKISKKTSDYNAFFSFCIKYRDKRKLLEKRGLYHSVIPIPIAVCLAAEWWEETPLSFFDDELRKELFETGLFEKICEKLRILDQSERAKQIVAKLWGTQSPFSTAEVLNTEMGSRLFRSVVEVNPEVTLDALEYTFDKLTHEDLLNFDLGRRNIIWALEKLVFRSELFHRAGKILARLAVAETENISNNATGQFAQLFQTFLPGTEANYSQRIELLDWCLSNEENIRYKEIAIEAMDKALKYRGVGRSGGFERQGFSTTFRDFSPSSWDELHGYWVNVINKLAYVAKQKKSYSESAKEKIAKSIRQFFSINLSDVIKSVILEIQAEYNTLWHSALTELNHVQNYDDLKDENKAIVEELINELTPKDFSNRLKLIVSLPPWESVKNEEGEYVDIAEKKAKEYAKEITNDNLPIEDHIAILLEGEQRQALAFGNEFGLSHPNPTELIKRTLSVLKSIPEEKRNLSFIGGLFASLDTEKHEEIFDFLISDMFFHNIIVYFVRMARVDRSLLFRLFSLLNNNLISVKDFSSLMYGRPFIRMESNDVSEFCRTLSNYSDQGAWVAFLIYSMYVPQDESEWPKHKVVVREFILKVNYPLPAANYQLDYTHWAVSMQKLLNKTNDIELAEFLIKQISFEMDNNRLFSFYSYNILEVLVSQYFDVFWSYFSPKIIRRDIGFLNFKSIFSGDNGSMPKEGILFRNIDIDFLINWLKDQPREGVYCISSMVPIMDIHSEEANWHPITKKIIDEFGSDDDVLSTIRSNMHTYGWQGSVIPYFQSLQNILSDLDKHHFQNVQVWARKMKKLLDDEIKRESLNDQHYYL